MTTIDTKHIFGPVPSRRLGMSLGVDLVPPKTCTLDCIYCESGKTTELTLQRKNYVSIEQIKKELSSALADKPALDFITLSGAGEPTLHHGIGKIITFIQSNYPQYKIALLTNGTLLYMPSVRAHIQHVDVMKVSVDAASEALFIRINRPCQAMDFDNMIQGLISFRKTFKSQFWVEVFIVPGINDTQAELEKIKYLLKELNPDRIQLNALDRPGTESWVASVDKSRMENIANYLYGADIIKHHDAHQTNEDRFESGANVIKRLHATLKRRPCTLEDVVRLSGVPTAEVRHRLNILLKKGEIIKKKMPRGVFYLIKTQ